MGRWGMKGCGGETGEQASVGKKQIIAQVSNKHHAMKGTGRQAGSPGPAGGGGTVLLKVTKGAHEAVNRNLG